MSRYATATTWILDPVPTISLGASALINGATDSNFQHPDALTAPGLHLPLVTKPLELGEPAQLRDRQLWIPAFGIA